MLRKLNVKGDEEVDMTVGEEEKEDVEGNGCLTKKVGENTMMMGRQVDVQEKTKHTNGSDEGVHEIPQQKFDNLDTVSNILHERDYVGMGGVEVLKDIINIPHNDSGDFLCNKENENSNEGKKSMRVWKRTARAQGVREGGVEEKSCLTKRKAIELENSILENDVGGREVLKMGLYRVIGNGESTSIWNDSWITGIQGGTLNPIHSNSWRPERVCELIDEDTHGWDIIKLWALFDANICEKILSIPPSRVCQSDVWAWSGEANGSFTVKSCYKMAMEESWDQTLLTPNLFCEVPTSFWKSMWRLPILPRFKVLMWRVCLEIIPTIEALEKRGMEIKDKCPWCSAEDETGYHVLIECEEIKHIWEHAPFDFNSRLSHGSILEWMAVEWDRWSREQRSSFVMALYHLWEARNNKKFGKESINLNNIWCKVERSGDEICAAESTTHLIHTSPTSLKWERPREPFIKLNVDVALKENGDGSVGGVFRDHEGMCVGAFSCKVTAMRDVALMEAMGIKKGIKIASEGGISHLIRI
ncbi:ribonuclease H [Senna tora]|uniref:Ribonuclease H n=1 Tax=Senna tora TaxID=362788 RepID=A0A834TJE7_9FABA|nr:ribonuclease H [Senna tora]